LISRSSVAECKLQEIVGNVLKVVTLHNPDEAVTHSVVKYAVLQETFV